MRSTPICQADTCRQACGHLRPVGGPEADEETGEARHHGAGDAGSSINDNVLNYRENNFLAAVHFGKGACGVAFLDISTGEFLTAEGPFDYVDKLLNNFAPKEVLFERGKRLMFEGNFGSKFFTFELDDWVFTETSAREKLLKHFEVKNLKGFGVEHLKNGIIASGAILQYLIMTQHTQIGHVTSLARIEEDKYVRLDKFTVAQPGVDGVDERRWQQSAECDRQDHQRWVPAC